MYLILLKIFLLGKKEREFSAKELLDIVLSDKSTEFRGALVGFTGLPKSGKTTLLSGMLPPNPKKCCPTKGLATYEIGIAVAPGDENHDWDEFTRQHAHLVMLARALFSECKEGFFPSVKKSDEGKINGLLMSKGLENKYLQNQYRNVFKIMMEVLPKLNRSNSCDCNLKSDIILINVWDIGVEKALYETLPLLARVASPLVLVNLFDLHRDVEIEKLHQCPNIKNAVDANEKIMRFRSRCHYFVRIAGLSKREVDVPTSILVATHRDQVSADKICSQVRQAETIIRAKASDMGVADTLVSTMITIDAREKTDCRHVQHALKKVIYSSEKTKKSLSLKWIFLRTALVNYETERSKFCISRDDFDDLAKQCGLTATERDDFLKFFSDLGSLISYPEILHENIVYKPDIFLQQLNKLYVYTTGRGKPDQHAAESLKKGILCRYVANQLWGCDVDFFWSVLQESGLAAATKSESRILQYDYGIECPNPSCHNTNCLFIPSVREKPQETKPEHGDKSTTNHSLFVTFNSEYVPTDIQAVFVRYMKLFFSEAQLKLTEEYNSTKFTFIEEEKDLVVIVHGDVIEIQPANSCQKHALKQLCLHVLESVMEYFPGMEYELGFICPNSEEKNPAKRREVHYVHFLPAQKEEKLYCFHCQKSVEISTEKQEWMQEKNVMHAMFVYREV